ncbi:MAG: NAD-dependent epimerase/dehydratase family protein [Pseudomonadota bacterium]
MRRVLLTGADGFVGRHVAARLMAGGAAVRAVDLAFAADADARLEQVVASVTDRAAMREAVEGVEGVIHAAAIAELWAPTEGAHDAVNVGGTESVLAAAEAAELPFVLVSSYTTLVARDTWPGALLDERAEHDPGALLGPYPAAKRMAELAVEAAAARGLRALSVLPSAPVGPGDRNLTPPGRMLRDLAVGRVPTLINTTLDLVDVRALADGIVAALERGAAGQRYLLAGEGMTLDALAERVAAETGVAPPRARVPIGIALAAARVEALIGRLTGRAPTAPLTGVRIAARRVRLDATRARNALDFRPPPADAALTEALAWFRREGLLGVRRGGVR